MKKHKEFVIVEEGTTYKLPKFRVVDAKGILKVSDLEKRDIPAHTGESIEAYSKKGQIQPQEFDFGDLTVKISSLGIDFISKSTGEKHCYFNKLGMFHLTEVLNTVNHNSAITFVRGDKTDNGKTIPRVDGITHEQLLGMMIYDMQYKNGLVPSRESSIAITKLQEALMWLQKRQEDREERKVQGTYEK